jgi:hypothetical protein
MRIGKDDISRPDPIDVTPRPQKHDPKNTRPFL